tara:strand:+ start:169 stop:411 length:243 start_codon:yes stop_codon:yes gene_type:complete
MTQKVQMIKIDYDQWSKFKGVKNNTIAESELRLIENLHAKYFNHALESLCTCRGEHIKGQIQLFVNELNVIYKNGYKGST